LVNFTPSIGVFIHNWGPWLMSHVKLSRKKLEDFAHNNTGISIRCSICYKEDKRNKHVYTNLPALWWHIKTVHDRKDENSEEKLEKLSKVFKKISYDIYSLAEKRNTSKYFLDYFE